MRDRLVREGVLAAGGGAGHAARPSAQRLSEAYDAAQKQAERYELQELSAVSDARRSATSARARP